MNRKELFDLIGGERCRYCRSTESIEFDHIDPETKLFTIGEWRNRPKEVLVAEVLKCQPLCSPCHWMKTSMQMWPRPGNKGVMRSDPEGYRKNYYEANRASHKAYKKQWHIENPSYSRDYYLKKTEGKRRVKELLIWVGPDTLETHERRNKLREQAKRMGIELDF